MRALHNFLHHRILVLLSMGRLREAQSELARGEELAEEQGELELLSWLCVDHVWLAWVSGAVTHPLEYAQRAAKLAEKVSGTLSRSFALWSLGVAHLLEGNGREAMEALKSGLAFARQRRVLLCWEGRVLSVLADAYLSGGELAAARTTAEEAVAVAQRQDALIDEIETQLALARVLRCSEGLASQQGIEAALERALGLVAKTGAKGLEPFLYVERAELAGLLGDAAACQRERCEALRLFTEIGATGHAERLAREGVAN